MPISYQIKLQFEEGQYKVYWLNMQTNTCDWFRQEVSFISEEMLKNWQETSLQKTIGEKLFLFLDGDARHFKRALDEAKKQGEVLLIYLNSCSQVADWPFELIVENDEFLLLDRVHLVRQITGWGAAKPMTPQNRPLKILFMACSAKDVTPELDYEGEEEAIYQITKDLAVNMDVDDSGSLDGLRSQLENFSYDVLQLSGHANITSDGRPYFVMEDNCGEAQKVFPDELWNNALIENPPRLLFLSGCRTGEKANIVDSGEAISFAQTLVEQFNVPAVLGWGRSVNDSQAIGAETMLFHELSRGKSILHAVQRARYDMQNNFTDEKRNDWPLLRLFSGGMALNPIVTTGQPVKPSARQMNTIYLMGSKNKDMTTGFVGRRTQIQQALHALEKDPYRIGLMLLGTAGLGKTALAKKISQRLTHYIPITVSGSLNEISLQAALTDAFIISQDKKGTAVLSQPDSMTEKLTRLCATSFKEQNYIILFDNFEQNMAKTATGLPGFVNGEAVELLQVLLRYLHICEKMTHLIITSRYGFSLTYQNQDLVAERLEHIYLNSFRESQQWKKLLQLNNLLEYKGGAMALEFMKEGKGNPQIMEIVDRVVGQMLAAEESQVKQAIQEERDRFIQQSGLFELLKNGKPELQKWIKCLSVYDRPVQDKEIEQVATKEGLKDYQGVLVEGRRLGLFEYDQAHQTYQVSPLL